MDAPLSSLAPNCPIQSDLAWDAHLDPIAQSSIALHSWTPTLLDKVAVDPHEYRSAGCRKVQETLIQLDCTNGASLPGLDGVGYTTTTTYEYDEDGSLFAKVVDGTRYLMTHDACGRVVELYQGKPLDEPLDTFTYSDEGWLLVHDVTDVGNLPGRHTYEWDDKGRLMDSVWDWGVDGSGVGYRFQRDEAGYVVREEYYMQDAQGLYQGAYETPDGDVLFSVKTYEYDAQGRILRSGRDGYAPLTGDSVIRNPPNGTDDETFAWTYDAQGRLASFTWAAWAGVGAYTFTWGPDGLLAAYETDDGLDGTTDHRSTFTHPDPGVVRVERADFGPTDGMVLTETVTVDPVEHVLSAVTEYGNGCVDSWTVWHDCSESLD